MRIQLLSDLHLEHADYDPTLADVDVVVLAGDIHTKGRAIDWARRHFSGPVVYVLGNHDNWGGNLTYTSDKLKKLAEGSNVHVLEQDELVLDGVRFLGATLWTDFSAAKHPPSAMIAAREKMNDYRKIREGAAYRRLHPSNVRLKSLETQMFFRRKLEQPFDGKTVIVTHHAPSVLSAGEYEEAETSLGASYFNCLEPMVEQVDLWVHGHIHESADYSVGRGRVVCNPRGYPGEFNEGFDPSLVIEL
ncbi:serine/threonine protein phosphatase [Paraburkholderia sp. UCT31]|uniref:metallophosphoesterase n=1 Tax=Paraburkholderia sp. UCT31 TaxID=2615209 RepID=UPI001655CB27|nr:metallophosphoesterase [Paraburkholderia sp. UCT31]MBC8737036.1 serine/threonine protein phosphatase [Paraburkholderia sp. UCT31]